MSLLRPQYLSSESMGTQFHEEIWTWNNEAFVREQGGHDWVVLMDFFATKACMELGRDWTLCLRRRGHGYHRKHPDMIQDD